MFTRGIIFQDGRRVRMRVFLRFSKSSHTVQCYFVVPGHRISKHGPDRPWCINNVLNALAVAAVDRRFGSTTRKHDVRRCELKCKSRCRVIDRQWMTVMWTRFKTPSIFLVELENGAGTIRHYRRRGMLANFSFVFRFPISATVPSRTPHALVSSPTTSVHSAFGLVFPPCPAGI